jgi:hypothetical protein
MATAVSTTCGSRGLRLLRQPLAVLVGFPLHAISRADPPTHRVDPFRPAKTRSPRRRHGARTLAGLRELALARCCCPAAAITLNRQLGRPGRALVNHRAQPREINQLRRVQRNG